jgi:hypothetical protein
VPRPEKDASSEAPDGETSSARAPGLTTGERYYQEVSRLLDDAFARKAIPDLAGSLAHGLAVIAIRCGPEATGDFLLKMGERLRLFAEVRRSQEEASELIRNGVKPH